MTNDGVRLEMNKVLQRIGASHDSHPMQKERDFARAVLIAWPPEERLFPFDRAVPLAGPI